MSLLVQAMLHPEDKEPAWAIFFSGQFERPIALLNDYEMRRFIDSYAQQRDKLPERRK